MKNLTDFKQKESEYLPAARLSEGVYQAEVSDLLTVRSPALTIVWLLDITDGDFAGSRIEYSYRADKSPEITVANFKAVGIDASNLQAVLENSSLIRGQQIKVLVKSDLIIFEPIQVGVLNKPKSSTSAPF